MRSLKLFLLLSLMSGYAWPQEQTKPPQNPVPLSSEEKQDVLGQLLLIPVLRTEILDYQRYIAEQDKIHEREKAVWLQTIANEQDKTRVTEKEKAIVERERNLALDQVKFYQNSLNVCLSNQKTSTWCKIKRFFSFGTVKCK